MLYYRIPDGEFCKDKEFWGTGYSGHGIGRNNPLMCGTSNIGPIPPGVYKIERPSYKHITEGPVVFNLTPLPETNTFGRDAFHIHGNNRSNDASKGCIILGPSIRDEINKAIEEEYLTVLAA